MDRKPRSDAKLKTMPEEQQAAVIEWLSKESLESTRQRVAREYDIKTSWAALSEFREWWNLREQFKRTQNTTEDLVELQRQLDTGLSEEQIQEYGQRVFSLLALKTEDPDVWDSTQKIGLKRREIELNREKLELERQRWQFDAAKAVLVKFDEIRAIRDDGTLDEDARLDRVRERLFGVVAG